MKRLLLVMLSALLVLAGCSSGKNNTPPQSSAPPAEFSAAPSAPESQPSLPEIGQLDDISVLDHAIREFGEEEGLLQYDSAFCYKILYPISGMPQVDQVIAGWAQGVRDAAAGEIEALSATDRLPEGTLTYNYNSYLIGERYASVEELGFFSHSGLAHPIEPIAIFHVDLEAQRILPNEELFVPGQTAGVLKLLAGKLLADNPDLAASLEEIDETWLESALLRPEGVEIILERGKYLASYLGTQRVLLSYEELGGALSIAEQLSGSPSREEGEHEAPKQPQVAPLPNPLDPGKPMVALTFDDGPTTTTGKILDLLEQHGGRATFFMVGNSVQSKSDIVRRMVAQGSEVANHTWDHKPLNKLTAQEIRQQLQSTNDIIYSVSGVRPVLMRPPYGAFNEQVQSVTAEMDTPIVNWSLDTLDWKTRSAAATYNAIMKDVRDGSIILCHDLHKETGEAMVTVIPELISRDYQLVTVSELLHTVQGGIKPGTVYTSGYAA